MNKEKPTYSKYLQLDKILDGQNPLSDIAGKPIHDETLFIIIHHYSQLFTPSSLSWQSFAQMSIDWVLCAPAGGLPPTQFALLFL